MRTLVASAALLLWAGVAEAQTCPFVLQGRPPIGATAHVFNMGTVRVTIWNGNHAIITPLVSEPVTLSATIAQDSGPRPVIFVVDLTPVLDACFPVELVQPITVAVAVTLGASGVDFARAYTLTMNGVTALISPGPRSVTLVADGCNPCVAGNVAAFHLRVANVFGPFAAVLTTGITFPDGISSAWPPRTIQIPTGEHDLPLQQIVVPSGIPNGVYTLQAALVDPATGETLSHTALRVEKQ